MILTKEVKLKVNNINRKYFESIGYGDLKINQIIVVPVEKLMKKSNVLVEVKCDNEKCHNKNYIRFCSYKYPHYCRECCAIKTKQTKLKRYGDENYNNFEKTIQTKLNKHGDKNYNNMEKNKQTKLKRYGDENYNNTEKNKQTKLERYGDENYHNMEKYMETCLEKYNHKNYFSTDEFKINQGIILNKDIIDKWKLYKRNSDKIFVKLKPKVFEKWDGYDFYDKEFIKNNFNLSSNHPNYPTVDHKLSVYYGFINNISVEDINKIENLVITKRKINASKGK